MQDEGKKFNASCFVFMTVDHKLHTGYDEYLLAFFSYLKICSKYDKLTNSHETALVVILRNYLICSNIL